MDIADLHGEVETDADFWVEVVDLSSLIRTNTECIGECRIGAAAPMSDTLRMSGGSGMTPSVRDRISVDLRGLRAALFEQARAHGVSPSDFVRRAVKQSLTVTGGADDETRRASDGPVARDRVRLSLRLSRADARRLVAAAGAAELPVGAYVTGLVAGIPLLTQNGNCRDHLDALVSSSAELATLSRNLHHLTTLLRQGEVRAAFAYAEMLQTLERDVRSHLALAAGALADLRPSRGTANRT